MVSPTVPRCFDSLAPRALSTRHLTGPVGPRTRNLSGVERELSTGQSFGLFQSYGPHSSTMIVERGWFAYWLGKTAAPPGSGTTGEDMPTSTAASGDSMRTALVSPRATSSVSA